MPDLLGSGWRAEHHAMEDEAARQTSQKGESTGAMFDEMLRLSGL